MEHQSRQERRRNARQIKKEERQKEKAKRKGARLLTRIFVTLIGIVLISAAGYWIFKDQATGPMGEFVPSLGNRHITRNQIGLTNYNSNPPTSGPHFPSIARWGIHENPIPKELQVHNLEDGGVMVQYNCQTSSPDCRELVSKLAQVVRQYKHAILAPYGNVSHRVALTAWTRIDKFNEFDEKRIASFIEAYMDIDHHASRR